MQQWMPVPLARNALPLVSMMLAGHLAAAEESHPSDPDADQVAGSPTAWTHPTGGWSVTSFMVLGARLAATVHDRVHLELSGLVPNSRVTFAGAAASIRVASVRRMRVAVRADADVGVDHDHDDGLHPYVQSFVVRDTGRAIGTSLISSVCLGATCRGGLTISLRQGFTEIDGVRYAETGAIGTIVVPAGSPLLYAQGVVERCAHADDCYDPAIQIGGGIRLSGDRWACQVGLIKLLSAKQDISDWTTVGSPFFSVTYRSP